MGHSGDHRMRRQALRQLHRTPLIDHKDTRRPLGIRPIDAPDVLAVVTAIVVGRGVVVARLWNPPCGLRAVQTGDVRIGDRGTSSLLGFYRWYEGGVLGNFPYDESGKWRWVCERPRKNENKKCFSRKHFPKSPLLFTWSKPLS